MQDFYGSICLSDIPKELIKEAKNGKKYLNINITQIKGGSDKHGNTHTIRAWRPKNMWTPGQQPDFIGVAKPFEERPHQQEDSDLGF